MNNLPGSEKTESVDRLLNEVRELREKGEYYKNILESADKGVWVINDMEKTVYINFWMAEMIGYTIDEVMGESILDFIDKSHSSRFMSRIAGCTVNCHEPFDMKLRRKDGKEIWVLAGLMPFFNKAGENVGINGTFVDITERKIMEMALRETKDNLEKAQRIGKIGSWVKDCRSNKLEFSEELCQILGVQKTPITMESIYGLIHRDDREIFTRTALSDFKNNGIYKADVRMIRDDGKLVYCYLEANLIPDADGMPDKVVGVLQDITERKLAEETRQKLLIKLKERVKELTALYDISSIVQASGDPDDVLKKIALTLPPAWQYHDITVARVTYDGKSFISPGFCETPWALRTDFSTSAGKTGAVEVYYTEEKKQVTDGPFLAEEKRLINTVTEIIKTYIEGRQAEDALLESEEKFRTLAETAPFAIFLHRGDSFIYINPAALRIAGRSSVDLSRIKFWDLFHPEHKELIKDRGLARLRGEDPPQRYEVKLNTQDDEKWIDITSSRVMYQGNTAILTVGIDVTQNKLNEIALQEAKENAEFFIDLISHDIGNLNHAVLGYLELAQDSLSIEDSHKDYIVKPMEIVNKSSRLIKDVRMLRQITNGSVEIKKVDAGKILAIVIDEWTPIKGVSINGPPPGKYCVMANEALGAAFSGIIANLSEFGKPGKLIDIDIARAQENGRQFCKFIFEDNGPGIPDELKKRLMADTWKQNGKTVRSNLGSKFVKALIEAYHGKFWMEDREPGDHTKGVRFLVMLPAAEE